MKRSAQVRLIVTPDQVCSITVNGRPAGRIALGPGGAFRSDALGRGRRNAVGLKVTQEDGCPPALLGELEIAFVKGGIIRLPIDATWRWTRGADAGWDQPAFSDDWTPLNVNSETPWGTPQNALHYFLPPAPLLRKSFTVAKPVRRCSTPRLWGL